MDTFFITTVIVLMFIILYLLKTTSNDEGDETAGEVVSNCFVYSNTTNAATTTKCTSVEASLATDKACIDDNEDWCYIEKDALGNDVAKSSGVDSKPEDDTPTVNNSCPYKCICPSLATA